MKKRKISDLLLFDLNPRYSNFLDINWDQVQKNGNKYSQETIAVNLLSFEEDFKSFKTLINSLASSGYDERQDQIICVETIKGDYIVAEGNRRTLAVKLLIDRNWANSIFDIFTNYIKNEENVNKNNKIINYSSELDELLSENDFVEEDRIKSIERLRNFINKLYDSNEINIKKFEEITINLYDKDSDFNNEDIKLSLNHAIFGRSVSAPGGKMKWPRFQTLKNTWDIYLKMMEENNNNDDDAIEKTSRFLNRSKSSVNIELSSARWVMYLKENYSGKYNLGDWKHIRTSAIELSLDVIDISDFIPDKKRLKDFLEIQIPSKGKNICIEKNETKNDTEISNFIVDSYLDNLYSTRGWKKNRSRKKLVEFINASNENKLFIDIMELGGSEATSVKNIEASSKMIELLINNLENNDYSVDNTVTEPTIIIKKFVQRLLKHEVIRLTKDFEIQTKEDYPFLSLVSIARTCIDLLMIYSFGIIEPLRSKILNIDNKKLFNNYGNKTEDEINKILFVDDFKTYGITQTINWKMSENKYSEFKKFLKNDYHFSNHSPYIEIIFNEYKNKLFNRTIHAPYWLNKKANISEIEKLVNSSLKIIYNFSLILGIKNIKELESL